MKIKNQTVIKAAALLGTSLIRTWMSTLDYRVCYYDPTVDPVHPSNPGRMIYVFWHEYILLPIHLRGHCNLAMLLSRHNDADVLYYLAQYLGFDTVRGSTRRGGATALMELIDKAAHMNLTITPDGPRGPRRQLAPGPVFLASKLGLPIVAMGLGVDRPWRLGSWDRFAIPRPGSRARGLVSPAMPIPPNLDRDGIEHYRAEVERMLNRLTVEAEAWAESGTRKLDEEPARREGLRGRRRRLDTAHAAPTPHSAITVPADLNQAVDARL